MSFGYRPSLSSASAGSMRKSNMSMDLAYWWSMLGLVAFFHGMLPREVKELVSKCLGFLRTYLDPYICFEIPEFESASSNELYKNVQLHVNANDMCKVANRVVLTRIRNSKQTCSNLAGNHHHHIPQNPPPLQSGWFTSTGFFCLFVLFCFIFFFCTIKLCSWFCGHFLSPPEGESIVDTFEGRKLWWQHSVHKLQGESMQGRGSQEAHDRLYTLKIHKRDRDWIIPRYIDHINARAAGYKRQNRYIIFSLVTN